MRQKGIVSSFDFKSMSAADLEKATDDLIETTKAAYEKVGALTKEEVTFESCIKVRHDGTKCRAGLPDFTL
jgi:hypothetical protein